jgi:Raf kinase inhibitor-like YbhB/YbcL family protein
MHLSSFAFPDGKLIPTKYAYHGVAGGENVSIPLAWEGAPGETRSFALSIIDPHPVAKNWVHWLVINMPPSASALAPGVSGGLMPPGSKELYNSYGTLGYGGPQPPKGSGPHPYEVTLYALNADTLDLPATSSLSGFLQAIRGKVLASAKTTGIYER